MEYRDAAPSVNSLSHVHLETSMVSRHLTPFHHDENSLVASNCSEEYPPTCEINLSAEWDFNKA